jgi:hypothetical protein
VYTGRVVALFFCNEGVDLSGGGFWKSALLGGVLALVIALGALAAYVYFRDDIAATQAGKASRIVVVAASTAADGSTVAGMVFVVSDADIRDVSPDTSVTIPGTSYGRLGDAYAFAGAAGVAGATQGSRSSGTVGWVDLPLKSWQAMLDRSGGVTVTVPVSVRVFDGTQLRSFAAGPQKLSGADASTLLLGTGSLSPAIRENVRTQLESAVLRALALEGSTEALIHTNLGADDLKGWLLRLSRAPLEASGTVVP